MRLLICAALLLAACTDIDGTPETASVMQVVGRLGYKPLDETSGLAQSTRDPGLLWAVNDDGPPVLYGIGSDGAKRGKVEVREAGHRDWEDLASFKLDGTAYLLVADIGDNGADRNDVTIYVVEEPAPDDKEVDIAWAFDFTYPDGPRDAEAVAVDIGEQRIYVLSKRDIPARLYRLPLHPDGGERIFADYLDTVASLPQPKRRDINNAAFNKDWHWQPTGMAIAPDGSAAVVLTYAGVYYYARGDRQWAAALQQPPLGLRLGRLPAAESITFDSDGAGALVTSEGARAPLVRISLDGVNKG